MYNNGKKGKMRKYSLIFLTLVFIANIAFAETKGQMRHLWMRYQIFSSSTERSNYIDRAKALKINTIFLTAPIVFNDRPSYYDDIINDLEGEGLEIYLAWFWHNTSINGVEQLSNKYDYLYRPLNMSETEWKNVIQTNPRWQDRSTTAELDKNNPNMINLTKNEAKKYFNEYPELDGIVLDYARMDGRIGSFHSSAQTYLNIKSKSSLSLDLGIIVNDIYGELPVPATIITANYGTQLVENGKALATYSHTGTGGGKKLAITLKEHSNNGYCLTFHWKTGVFEMPIVNNVFNLYKEKTGYAGNNLYIWNYTDDFNSFSTDGVKHAKEWAYSNSLNPVLVTSISSVPAGAPLVLGLPWKISSLIATDLINHAETGAVIALLRGAASTALASDNSNYRILTGYAGNSMISPLEDKWPQGIAINITQDGIDQNLPSNNRSASENVTIAKNWHNWNTREMIGGGIYELKKMLKDTYNEKKNVVVCVWESLHIYDQQQDWAYWINNGYCDLIVQMVYKNNLSDFISALNYSKGKMNGFSEKYHPVIALNSNSTGIQSASIVNEQIRETLSSFSLSGFGLFGLDNTNFSVSYCNSASNNIDSYISSDRFLVQEAPIRPTTLRNDSKPIISYNANTLANEIIYINKNNNLSLQIGNNGGSFLDVVDIDLTNLNETVNDESFTIANNATKTVDISINPSSPGPINTYLRIRSNNNGTDNTETYQLTLNAVDASPKVEFSKTAINFPVTTLNQSISETITISNSGIEDLTISSYNWTDKTNFSVGSIQSTFSSSVSQNIQITYHPKTTGNHSTQLVITSNDPNNSEINIPLSGTSNNPPELSLSTTSLNFESVEINTQKTFNITLSNIGGALLQINSCSITQGQPFQLGSYSESLLPGESQDIQVTFLPGSLGTFVGTLNVNSNNPNNEILAIPLSGSSFAPPEITSSVTSINFGSNPVNTDQNSSLTISNTGGSPLVISSCILTVNQGFSIINSPESIPAGESQNIQLSFSSIEAGIFTSVLKIVSDANNMDTLSISLSASSFVPPQISYTSKTLDFGSIEINHSKSIDYNITNSGGTQLQISSCTLTNNVIFEIISFPETVESGETQKIQLSYTPMEIGNFSSILKIISNDPEQNILSVTFQGSSYAPPEITFSLESLDFGVVKKNSEETYYLDFSNTGGSDLTISSCALTLSDQFKVIKYPETVTPNTEQNIELSFTPKELIEYNDTLNIVCNDPDRTEVTISLKGTGGKPQLQIMFPSNRRR